ncbi:hypothetical protein J437_LFUL009420 [Ladona fulva]|uniref:Tudor domain-containing protein n=1 Tax=Ladona fulva TaxID=123851 RepID=A0A8K0KC33_LADFU|nr:hypothetical protein J437_LFUL009420 [Ladona fulva]
MSGFFPATLFVRGKETSDEDPWDDTLLIKQYDESVSLLKEEVAKLMEISGSGEESASSKGKSFSAHKMKKKRHGVKTPPEWEVGSFCRAKYSEDGKLYEGKIIRIDENAGTCIVRYIGYGNEENVYMDALLPTCGRSARKAQEDRAMEEQLFEIEGALDLSDSVSAKEDRRNSKAAHQTPHVGKRHGRRKMDSPEMFPSFSQGRQSHENVHNLEWPPHIPPPPPPPPNLFEHFTTNDSEALSAMLMSWYMSGYHTGYYYGLKQAKTQQNMEYGGRQSRMGRSSEDEGESSSTEQATCKDDNDDERPLKKARYIWQIKGKYHLKDKERKLFLPSDSRGESMTVPVEYKSFSPVCCGNDDNPDSRDGAMESSPSETIALDECPVKCPSPLQDIEEVIKEDSTVCEVPEKEDNSEVNHPAAPLRFIIDREPSPLSPRSSSCCFQSFLHSVNHSSLHVRKWQTKQLAKGIVDNTINKVLEDMGFVPLPEDADDVFNEPVNCNDSHQNFENEAVLMAIQSHGLQRNEFGSDCSKESESKGTSNPDGNKSNSVSIERASDPSTRCAPCACTLPQVMSDMDVLEQYSPFRQRHSLDVFQSAVKNTKNRFNTNSRSDSGKWFQDIENSVMPLGFNSDCYGLESSSSSEENTDSDDSFVKLDCEEEVDDKIMVIGLEDGRGCDSKMSESESQQEAAVEKPMPLVEHDDFLDQAVAVAIQKKGLSVFGCIDNG